MSETKPSDPQTKKKPPSVGSWLLVLFVAIFLLVMIGNSSVRQEDRLSQDEYLYHLFSGRIERQNFRGTNEGATGIEGKYVPTRGGEARQFRTEFSDVRALEQLFQDVKARRYRMVTPEALEQAVAGGWYRPMRADSLTTFTVYADAVPPDSLARLRARRAAGESDSESEVAAEGQTEAPEETARAGEAAPPEASAEVAAAEGETAAPIASDRRVRQEERLFVEVVARGRGSWEAIEDPPFPLPERSGHLWLDVDVGRTQDLAGLLAVLETSGVRPERRSLELTEQGGSRFSDSSSRFGTFLLFGLPSLLILVILIMMLRQVRGQGGAGGVMNFGRSRAQLYSKENRTNVTFNDVAGAGEAKAEVSELVEFLKNPGRFARVGGRIPRGVLLVGPPGCGKTLLAKAIAGEAEVPFFSISGSDFVEMFVGVGASRVRDLFKQARESSPCIIFLDEIDAVGRRRGSGMGGGHDEREQTLNAILVEMDGFGTDEGIIVIAASNRPDVLDPALLRPGRFDREVTIDLPDMEGRGEILEVHLGKVKVERGVDVGVLARSTPGYSGAELAAIVNEAAIMAVLAGREAISMGDLEEARDKVRYGRQKISRKMEARDREITAYHEAGHAIIAAVIEHADPPHKVTIVPRGRALGATMILPERESYHLQRKRLLAQLCVLFGGRVAEAEFCGDISAGASDDIRRATDLARAMVTELGMSDRIGPVNYADRQGSDFLGTELMRGKNHSEETAREIDAEIKALVDDAYRRAEEIVRANREGMERVTRALLEYETITGEEVRKLLDGASIAGLRPDPPATTQPEERPAGALRRQRDEPSDRRGDLPGEAGLSPA